MKPNWSRLSLLVICISSAAASAGADTGVPWLYVSAPTERAEPPVALTPRPAAEGALPVRLAAVAGGRVATSFRGAVSDAERFVWLGFAFRASGLFAISVVPGEPVASTMVFVQGAPLANVVGSTTDFAALSLPATAPFPYFAAVRLERAGALDVPVTIRLRGFAPCVNQLQAPCGTLADSFPEGFLLEAGAFGPEGPSVPDVMVPAIVRTDGLHGPVRSDLSLANRTEAPVRVLLQMLLRDGGTSNVVPVDLAPRSRQRITDVVATMLAGEGSVSAEGALAIRGFVPAVSGDLVAETYYDKGEAGRVGTVLPAFIEGGRGVSRVLLSSTTEGNPRLNVFSSTPVGSGPPVAQRFEVRVAVPGEPPAIHPFAFSRGQYVSARLFDLIGAPDGDGLVTVETDDPDLHAILTRSDPVSGSPSIVASN